MKKVENVHLSNGTMDILVSSFGAELSSVRKNGKEYLWQADPRFWKRHSPVLFPIVGSVWANHYRHQGTEYTLTQHGFARDMNFDKLSETADEVWFVLRDSEESRAKYPFAFELKIGYRLHGHTVDVMWEVTNPSQETLHFQIGAHPAFFYPNYKYPATNAQNLAALGVVETAASETTSEENPFTDATQRGYFSFDRSEGVQYILISEKGCADPDTHYPLQLTDGLLPIDTHTFDRDALIIEEGQVKEVTLHDLQRKPVLKLRFEEAPLVGLWSPPGKNAPFLCIEPWYGRCDRAHYQGEYADKDWMQHLAAGATFRGGYYIEILEEQGDE